MPTDFIIQNGMMMSPPGSVNKGPQTVTDSVFQGSSPHSEQWRKQGGVDTPLRVSDIGPDLGYVDKAMLILGSLVGGYLLIKFLQIVLRFLKPW